MAEKKNIMAMVTAFAGAATNVILNLILIPIMGANGAAIATAVSFLVAFAARALDARRFLKINYNTPVVVLEILILATQSTVMLVMKSGIVMYALEALLLLVMVAINYKQLLELFNLVVDKFLKKKKS